MSTHQQGARFLQVQARRIQTAQSQIDMDALFIYYFSKSSG
jgi:hypothetical protein